MTIKRIKTRVEEREGERERRERERESADVTEVFFDGFDCVFGVMENGRSERGGGLAIPERKRRREKERKTEREKERKTKRQKDRSQKLKTFEKKRE